MTVQEERHNAIIRIIGEQKDVVKEGMSLVEKCNARDEWKRMYDGLMKVMTNADIKEFAYIDMGSVKRGVTPSGKVWEFYSNSFGCTIRSLHCGTLRVGGEVIFTSGTFARCIETVMKS